MALFGKAKSLPAGSEAFYSATLSSWLGAQTRAISARGHDSFRTNVLSTIDEDRSGGKVWLEAWQEDKERWTIERHGIAAGVYSATPVLYCPSYFDALHHCALFEEGRKRGGAVVLESDAVSKNVPHYADVARETGQPLDLSGIPHPVLKGRLLVPGDFNEDQRAVIVKTAEDKIPMSAFPAMPAHEMLPIVALTMAGPVVVESADLQASKIDEDAVKGLKEVSSSLDDVIMSLNTSIDYKFQSEIHSYKLLSSLWALSVIIPVLDLTIDGPDSRRIYRNQAALVEKYCRKFDKKVQRLPEDRAAEKKMFLDFSRAARAVSCLEQVAALKGIAGKRPLSERQMRKGLTLIDRAAAQVPEMIKVADANTLKAQWQSGSFPAPRTFYKVLADEAVPRVKEMIRAKINEVEGRNSAPSAFPRLPQPPDKMP